MAPTLTFDILRCIHKACDFKTRRVFQEALGWGKDPLLFRGLLSEEVEVLFRGSNASPGWIRYDKNEVISRWSLGGSKSGPKGVYLHRILMPDISPWKKDHTGHWKHEIKAGRQHNEYQITECVEWCSPQCNRYMLLFYASHIAHPVWPLGQDIFARHVPKKRSRRPTPIGKIENGIPNWNGEMEIDFYCTCNVCDTIILGKHFVTIYQDNRWYSENLGRAVQISFFTEETTKMILKNYHGSKGVDDHMEDWMIGLLGPKAKVPLDICCYHLPMRGPWP